MLGYSRNFFGFGLVPGFLSKFSVRGIYVEIVENLVQKDILPSEKTQFIFDPKET